MLGRRDLPAARSDASEELSVCPSCGRPTRTVGRGSCADCWQPKREGGEPAIRATEPRAQPLGLFDLLDDVPVLVWALVVVAAIGVAVRISISLF